MPSVQDFDFDAYLFAFYLRKCCLKLSTACNIHCIAFRLYFGMEFTVLPMRLNCLKKSDSKKLFQKVLKRD